MIQKTRHIPEGSREVTRDGLAAVCYLEDRAGRFLAKGYKGKATKAAFYYSFRTEAARDEHVARFFDNVAAMVRYSADRRAEQAAKRAAGHGFQVGDIVYTSWGYDQTNVDWYEVTDASSPKSVKLRKIAGTVEDTGYMSGRAMPSKGQFVGEEFRTIWTGAGIKADGRGAMRWDGKPKSCSWYH